MPNWCTNKIKVEGEQEDVEKFVELVAGQDHEGEPTALRFNNLVPDPLYNPAAEAMSNKQHDWRLKNWGTKWEPNEATMEWDGPGAVYECLTAWTPPVPWLRHAAKRFPTLTFKIFWDEPGMDLWGAWRSDEDGK